MRYYISDFHFGHKNILKFERRNFKTIEDHDNYILSLLEERLNQEDTLYFLGDLGKLQGDYLERFCNLSGYKIMIKGNHDKHSNLYYKQCYHFDEVYSHPLWLTDRIMISHEPQPVEKGVLNIHGHLHGSYISLDNYINVSIHVRDYELLNQDEVDKFLSTLKAPCRDFFYEWYHDYHVLTKDSANFRKDLILDDENHILGFSKEGLAALSEKPIALKTAIDINRTFLISKQIKINNRYYKIVSISEDSSEIILMDILTYKTTKYDLSILARS